MGFHIVNIKNGVLEHQYTEKYNDLLYIDFITEDSIIYEGHENWTPVKVGDHDKYKRLSRAEFRAGLIAEIVFEKQAYENNFILQKLDQGQETFKLYQNMCDKYYKRPDYTIRNGVNIDIDVKCYNFHENSKKGRYINFNINEAGRFGSMQKLTKNKLIIALYEKKQNRPVEDTLYMFSIDYFLSYLKENRIPRTQEYASFPISETVEGFELINRCSG